MRDESKTQSSARLAAAPASEPGYACAICGVTVAARPVGGPASTDAPSDSALEPAAAKAAAAHRYRPFCSARCQRIDLGNWLDERYVVPGPPVPSDGGDEAEGDSGEPK
jgi:endogenous inhibitor of DNA gyrase (YacG/DUF329 family)